jgi:hypothetical protein
MIVKIINDINYAVSLQENRRFKQGTILELDGNLANRLIELNAAEKYEKQKNLKLDEPVQENKSLNPVIEDKHKKPKERKKQLRKNKVD